jgi:hypothetical protein
MLRDRCPETVNFALKWCNAKTRWVEHAYRNFIKIYVAKDERYHATRITLGIAKYYRNFDFDKSINWDDLTDEEANYWYKISETVKWFTKYFAYIKNTCEILLSKGYDDVGCKVDIISYYLSERLPDANLLIEDENAYNKQMNEVDKFADYLLKCAKQSLGRL